MLPIYMLSAIDQRIKYLKINKSYGAVCVRTQGLIKKQVINIPSPLQRGEVEYCVQKNQESGHIIDYKTHRHSNRERNKGRINFCACELYELRIIKSFLRLSTRAVPFLGCFNVKQLYFRQVSSPKSGYFFRRVELTKRKIGAQLFLESAYFNATRNGAQNELIQRIICAAIILLGSLTHGYLLTGLWRRSLSSLLFRIQVSSAEILSSLLLQNAPLSCLPLKRRFKKSKLYR